MRPNVSDYLNESNIYLFEQLTDWGSIDLVWSEGKEFSFTVVEFEILIKTPKEGDNCNSFTNLLLDIYSKVNGKAADNEMDLGKKA